MPDSLPSRPTLAGLASVAAELGDLKRLRDATSSDSLATRLFRRCWGSLVAGQPIHEVALVGTGSAVAACRLGGIDRSVLEMAGLTSDEAGAVMVRGLDEMGGSIDAALVAQLRQHLSIPLWSGSVPAFAEALIRQPRAGATCPGKPRIVLEPPEGHGDHCMIVAVLACLVAPRFGADPGQAFLAAMTHHLHNAHLPDSGFAGEMLLGDHLGPIMQTLFARELATLPADLAAASRAALDLIGMADNPVGRAFNAADVIDRVLQMAHYDQVAQFRTAQALDDLHLVHAGPVQAFHYDILRDAGLI